MKNLILLCLSMMFALTACAKQSDDWEVIHTATEPVESPYTVTGDFSGVSMRILDDTITTESLEFVLSNYSGTEVYSCDWFSVEKFVNGGWQTIPYIENVQFHNMSTTLLGDFENQTYECNWKDLYGQLQDGSYRVITKILIDVGSENDISYYLEDSFIIGFGLVESSYHAIDDVPQVGISIVESADTESVSVEIAYSGNGELHVVDWHAVEINKEGKWYTITDEDVNVEDMEYVILPNDSLVMTFKMANSRVKFPSGDYRLIIRGTEKKGSGEEVNYYFSVYFTI